MSTQSAPSAAELQRLFEELLARYKGELAGAANEPALRVVHARYLGKEGDIRKRLAEALKAAPGPEKRAIGQAGNAAIQRAEELFQGQLHALHEAARRADLHRRVDVTLPGRAPRLGALHLLTQVRRELEAIFAEIGFSVASGPQIETDFHNFEALAMPADHPARDMQDTFYLRAQATGAGQLLLRTHTSPVQIRTMLAQKPPVRIISPGKVYRKDDDPTHSPMFQQIEGLCIDTGVTFADLKGTLLYFVQRFFGRDVNLRLRPSFFPFVEPGAEVDIVCFLCKGKGCRTCKHTGYIEILGCGMVDPEVFRHVGYDSEKYSGFAFGTGIERMAMLRYGLSDLRLFFAGDVRFSRQFR
ncbi:MAG: phenylalanine--tRNA ligase subunit alpha [Polyangia bacterium]